MQVHTGFSKSIDTPQEVVMTIGYFDGVHRGHQELLRQVVAKARALGVPAVVLTFDQHPSRVLRPDSPVPQLFSLADRLREVAALGVDHTYVIPFTWEVAQESAEEFLQGVQTRFRPREVIVGHDFAVGKARSGDFAFLAEFAKRTGFRVEQVPAVVVDGEIVSSTYLRRLLAAGEVEKMKPLLGRPFTLEGKVVAGDGRGKTMGFATANLEPISEILPAMGVYVTEFRTPHSANSYQSVTNVGRKPTFHTHHEIVVETHVFDLNENVASLDVQVLFHRRLRGELKFPSAHELIKQIESDVAAAKNYFTKKS